MAVQIEGMTVTEAVIDNIEDGKATLTIPATRLVVQVRQSLDLAAVKEPESESIIIGAVENETVAPEAKQPVQAADTPAPAQPTQPAPVTQASSVQDVGEGIHSMNLDSSAID